MKEKINIMTIALMLLAVCTYGQTDKILTNNGWNLNQCITYALENNIDLSKTRLQAETASADLMQSKGARLPSLNGSVSQSGVNNRTFNDNGSSDGWSLSYSGSVSVNAVVTLYNGGVLNNKLKRSELAGEAAALNVTQAEMDITLAVTQAYLNVLYARENVAYYQDVVDASEKQVVRGKALLKAGSLSRRDLADLEAQLASDRYDFVTAQNALVSRITDIKQLLEISVEDEITLFFPSSDELQVVTILPSRSEAFRKALGNRPEIAYSENQFSMAELDVKSAKAAYLPSLSLNASMSSSYSDALSSGYSSQLSDHFFQGVDLTLSVPIFNRLSTKASVTKRRIDLQNAQLTVTNIRNSLLQTVEQVYQDSYAGQQQYDAAMAQENAAKESFRLSEEQFNLGMLNTIEWLQTRNNYLSARRELIQAKYSSILYRKILDYYMGVPIEL